MKSTAKAWIAQRSAIARTARPRSLAPLVLLALACATPGRPGAMAPASALAEARRLEIEAGSALEAGQVSMAIRAELGLLAVAREAGLGGDRAASSDPKSSAEMLALAEAADAARAALAAIGSRMSLEVSGEWVDSHGNQQAGDVAALAAGKGPSPAVYLFIGTGSGKAPVADAPIAFAFAANSGSLVGSVATDAWGKANTTVSSLASPSQAATIRAWPEYRYREESWSPPGLHRDFAYLRSTPVLRVAVYESTRGAGDGIRTSPYLAPGSWLDALGGTLRPLATAAGHEITVAGADPGLRFLPLAFSGDASAVAELCSTGQGAGSSASVLGLAALETSPARQVELGGRKYAIFSCEDSVTFRLVGRDGRILWTVGPLAAKGQGGTAELAEKDARDGAWAALEDGLKRGGSTIVEALMTASGNR